MKMLNKDAALMAVGFVLYWLVLVSLIILSGPSMRPDGICCDEGISGAWGISWMALGLMFFFYKIFSLLDLE